MSVDKTMNPVNSVDATEYYRIILANVRPELKKYVQKKWTDAVHADPSRQAYPIRATLNGIEIQANALLSAGKMKEFTGYILPGCDLVKINRSTGATDILGWRANLLVPDGMISTDGRKKPVIFNMSVFGNRVTLWKDKELQQEQQKRVHLPLFRMVTIMAEQREYTAGGVKKTGWTLQYLKEVHGKEPVDLDRLADLLEQCAIEIEDLSEKKHLYETVVLKNVVWRHAEPVDFWVESEKDFTQVAQTNPDGSQMVRINTITGRPEPVFKQIPKRVKSPIGQPFFQDKIGDEKEPVAPEVMTLKLNLSNSDWLKAELKDYPHRPSVVFQNYRYGQPFLFMFGKEQIVNDARSRGNLLDPDPLKNPFAELNNAWKGTKLLVMANLTRWSTYVRDNQKTFWITLLPGLVMYASAGTMLSKDRDYPPLPADIPAEIITKTAAGRVRAEVERREAIAPPVTGESIPSEASKTQVGYEEQVIQPREEEMEEGDRFAARQAVLNKMTVKQLKEIYDIFRNERYAVEPCKVKKEYIAQIIRVEAGLVPQEYPKEEIIEPEMVKPGREKEPDTRREEIEQILNDVIRDLPELKKFEDLWGADNDLGIFPDWVTPAHADIINAVLKEITE